MHFFECLKMLITAESNQRFEILLKMTLFIYGGNKYVHFINNIYIYVDFVSLSDYRNEMKMLN